MFVRSLSRSFSAVKQSKSSDEIKQWLNPQGQKLAVAWFSATWCGPCKAVSGSIEKLSETYKDSVTVIKIDIDDCADIAQAYNVTSVPTFHFVKGGKAVESVVGASAEKVKLAIEKLK
jgi:thioredoxin